MTLEAEGMKRAAEFGLSTAVVRTCQAGSGRELPSTPFVSTSPLMISTGPGMWPRQVTRPTRRSPLSLHIEIYDPTHGKRYVADKSRDQVLEECGIYLVGRISVWLRHTSR